MRKTLVLSLNLLLLVSFAYSQEQEAELVKQSFSNYKQAILEGKGEEAAKWVDSNTIAYYVKMLDLAKNADSTEVQKLLVIDKLTVLTARVRVPKDLALSMDGNEFFVYAIDNGMVGKNSVMNVEIGEVKVEGNFANGQMLSNGQVTPLYFQFNKEEEVWKIDLTSIFPASNAGIAQMIESNGMTDTEFILQALEMLSGSKVDNSVWYPLNGK